MVDETKNEILIDDVLSTREKFINHYKNDKWLAEVDRDNSIWINNGNKCAMIRHRRLNGEFSITIVLQEYSDEFGWDDREWIGLIDGKMKDIEELVTQEFYDSLIPELKMALNNL